jgi:hypothetical protein
MLRMVSLGPIAVAVAAADDLVLAELFFRQLLLMP